jgi:hypothetical protein
MSDNKDSIIPGGSKLTLKPRNFEEVSPTTGPSVPPPSKKAKKKKKGNKLKPAKESGKFSMRFMGQSIGSFFVGSLILGLFLYHQATGMEILTPQQANLGRGIAITSFVVILIIEAFTEDMMQGILSLFLLPYSFVYGLLFADAGPIRGLTVAVLVFFGAEMYFTPKNALVPQITKAVNGWIQSGQDKLIYPDGRPEAGFEKR